jgi:hypothetical protein
MYTTSQAQALQAKLRRLKEETQALQDFWATLFPDFEPLETRQCQVWIGRYDFNHICEGLEVTQAQQSKRLDAWAEGGDPAKLKPPMTRLDVIKYASGTMKNKKNEAAE